MNKKIKTGVVLVLTLIAIITQTGCIEKSEPVTKTSYYMDTICEITIYDMEDMSEDKAESAINDAFSLCADYEALISTTVKDSDIYKINHSKGNPVTCDERTIEVIKEGIQYGKLSKGRFDITIGKVTDLWDFHDNKSKVPAKSSLEKALKMVDYKQIAIDGNKVTMGKIGGEINLGGIGKGYIADKATALLKEKGVTSAIINFGGNIVTIGDKAGTPFRIGVEKPYSDRNEIIGYVDVDNAVVVTSGTYERYIEADGKKYHHIIDVNTGYSVETDVDGVSIVSEAGRSADADALSTICLILGTEEGKKLIESIDGVEAVFIDKKGNITKTSGMDTFVEQKN